VASHSPYYHQVTSQLNDLIENINEKQKETDDMVKINPPPCFIAYAEGGEEQFLELKMMLETIRSMVRLQTKVQWYQFRLEGINDLYAGIAKREKESLEDLSITQDLFAEITPTLEYIEAQHAEIMAELERERAAVVEIDKCDPKALAEVKSSIADNATQLKMLEEEVADIQKDINGSNKRGEDFRAEQKTLQQKIDYAGRMVIHSSTKQDLFGQTKGTQIPKGVYCNLTHLLNRRDPLPTICISLESFEDQSVASESRIRWTNISDDSMQELDPNPRNM
jgi:kinetochore protein Spc7/SPC105